MCKHEFMKTLMCLAITNFAFWGTCLSSKYQFTYQYLFDESENQLAVCAVMLIIHPFLLAMMVYFAEFNYYLAETLFLLIVLVLSAFGSITSNQRHRRTNLIGIHNATTGRRASVTLCSGDVLFTFLCFLLTLLFVFFVFFTKEEEYTSSVL